MKLLHLYHDIMNLYGDYANVNVLERVIVNSGESCVVEKKTLGDSVNFETYDFIFIGSGTERNQKVVLADLQQNADSLKKAIDSGKVILMTGNSFEMLGKAITDCVGTVYEGLGIFDFTAAEQNQRRITSDVILEADFLDTPLVGFINKCSEIKGIKTPMFTVKMGLGNSGGESGEGVRLNNLFCTHLTGPALVKNPHFLEYIASLLLGRPAAGSCLEYEKKGYEVTLRELTNRMNRN